MTVSLHYCLTCDIKGLNADRLCVPAVCDDIFLDQDILFSFFKSDILMVRSCRFVEAVQIYHVDITMQFSCIY